MFQEAADYQDWIDDLRKVCGDHQARVLAYCLMPNHYHLCVRTDGDPLSVVMHRLNLRQAKRFNRRHWTWGHLNQGRCRSVAVNDDRQLVALVRYIHRNPVEAGLARSCAGWPWSSHSAYLEPAAGWIAAAPVRELLGGASEYLAFVESPEVASHPVFQGAARNLLTSSWHTDRGDPEHEWLGRSLDAPGPRRASRRATNPESRLAPPMPVAVAAARWAEANSASLLTLQGPSRRQPLPSLRRKPSQEARGAPARRGILAHRDRLHPRAPPASGDQVARPAGGGRFQWPAGFSGGSACSLPSGNGMTGTRPPCRERIPAGGWLRVVR